MIEKAIAHRCAVFGGGPVLAMMVVPERPKSGFIVEIQQTEGCVITVISRDDARALADWIQTQLLLP